MTGFGVRDAVQRIPILLLTGLYLLVGLWLDGQASALFAMVSFPAGHMWLLAIALLSGLLMAALVVRRPGPWHLLDVVLFLAPTAVIAFSAAGEGISGIILGIGVLTIGAAAIYGLTRLPIPGFSRIAFVATFAVAIWFATFLAVTLSPISFPRHVGTLALGFVFFGLCAIAIQIALWRPIYGVWPLLIVVVCFLFNEQQHRLDVRDLSMSGDVARSVDTYGMVSLRESFAEWLSSRNDLEAYSGRRYPVFIVSAEGGGGYAAAHAYLFLAKMQRRCPNFAQHVFAIVGVSGGAVGDALFWRSLRENLNPTEALGCEGDGRSPEDIELLSTDHLSPVIAALFFHDFPNKILLGALGVLERSETRDRSAALSRSLANGAQSGTPGNPYFWDHYWSWSSDGRLRLGETPAIIPVATNAVSGKRYVLAPFNFAYPRCRFEEAVLDLAESGPYSVCPVQQDFSLEPWKDGNVEVASPRVRDLLLFDAAVASASFPYVTPSVLLPGWHGRDIALVDGGYLDNSGAETVREIVSELQDPVYYFDGMTVLGIEKPASWAGASEMCLDSFYDSPYRIAPQPFDLARGIVLTDENESVCPPEFEIRTITIRSEPTDRRFADKQNFFLDPVRALKNTRARRGETARRALLAQLCGGVDCPPQVEAGNLPAIGFLDSVIETSPLALPLGWHIPPERIEAMDRVVVPDAPGREQCATTSIFQTMCDNYYSVEAIEDALSPTE